MSDNFDNGIIVNEFDNDGVANFRDGVAALASYGLDTIIPVYIDSYGGYVDSLLAMIDIMDATPNKFLTVCLGKAMSCGAILLSHGDIRYCGAYGRVMIHKVSSASWGDIDSLKSLTDETDRLNKIALGILANNCNITYNQLEEKIHATTDKRTLWLDAQSAVKLGIVDKVGVPMPNKRTMLDISVTEASSSIKTHVQPKSKRKSKRKKR